MKVGIKQSKLSKNRQGDLATLDIKTKMKIIEIREGKFIKYKLELQQWSCKTVCVYESENKNYNGIETRDRLCSDRQHQTLKFGVV